MPIPAYYANCPECSGSYRIARNAKGEARVRKHTAHLTWVFKDANGQEFAEVETGDSVPCPGSGRRLPVHDIPEEVMKGRAK